MENITIPNLCQLIEPHIVMLEQSILKDAKYTRLNDSENDSGLALLKIELNLTNNATGEDWLLSLVAKTLPRRIEEQKLIRIQNELKNEVGIYMSAKHSIEDYLREIGIKNGTDYFAQPFGGRLNLNEDDKVDHNAVLVLPNYCIYGFKTISPRVGFDLDTSEFLLKALAKFHGTFIGLKFHKVEEFKEKVQPYLTNSYMPENTEKTARRHLADVLEENDFPEDVVERALATFDRKSVKEVREPWATFIHNNASINNTLIKYDSEQKPQRGKFLEFSRSEYNSPLRDLIFFLLSSVELETLETRLDDLIDCYYYCLIETLKRVDIQSKALFCRLAFNKELKIAANQSEFYNILCMLYTILGHPIDVKCDSNRNHISELQDTVHKTRICYIVKEFDKRGWLNL